MKYSAVLGPLDQAISALRRVDPDCAALLLLRIVNRDLVEKECGVARDKPFFRAPPEPEHSSA